MSSGKDASAQVPPPKCPQQGIVEQFNVSDGLGLIRLEDGHRVRFRRSGCRGDFLPLETVPVQILELTPQGMEGWRATVVTATEETYSVSDRLLDERSESKDAEEAITNARKTGFISVLLDVQVSSRQSLRAMLEPVATAIGGRLEVSAETPRMRIGDTDLTLLMSATPYPRERADLRFWPEELSLGKSFLCLEHGAVGFEMQTRRMMQSSTEDAGRDDAWDADGRIRQRLRFLVELLELHGVGVIAHAAGDVAWTKNEWLRRLGDVNDTSLRGFTGLIDVGADGTRLFTQGMDPLGLPDVTLDMAKLKLNETESYDRAQMAILFACHWMTFRDRILPEQESFVVPLGIEISSSPINHDNPGLSFDLVDTYKVSDFGSTLELTPTASLLPITEHWAAMTARGEEFPFPAYRSLLKASLEKQRWTQVARMMFVRNEQVPEHEILVMRRPHGTFSTISCGFGRLVQPRGTAVANNDRIELVVTLSRHDPRLANFLSYMGRILHSRDRGDPPWGPDHRIQLDGRLSDIGFPFLVLAWIGTLELGGGPQVRLYTPIPMTQNERDTVAIEQVPHWIQNTGMGVLEMRWQTLFSQAPQKPSTNES